MRSVLIIILGFVWLADNTVYGFTSSLACPSRVSKAVCIQDLNFVRQRQRLQARRLGTTFSRRIHAPRILRAMLDVEDLFKGVDPPPENVLQAVEAAGRRITCADIATEVGISLSEAQEALSTLAMLTGGALEVSRDGDIVYVFDPSFRIKLRARYSSNSH